MWGELNPPQIVGTVKVAPPICNTDVVRTGFEPVFNVYLNLISASYRQCFTL